MSVRMGSVVHNVADLDRAFAFWSAVLGFGLRDRSDDFVVLKGEHVNLSLQLSPDPKAGPNRVHLDLYADDFEAEAARIVELGATFVRREVDEAGGFVTLLDPDGNEFCVCGWTPAEYGQRMGSKDKGGRETKKPKKDKK